MIPWVSFSIGNGSNTFLWLDPWLPGNKFLGEALNSQMKLVLGKKKKALMSDFIDDNGWKSQDSRRLKPFSDLCLEVKVNGFGRDLVCLDGFQFPNLRQIWDVHHVKAPKVPWFNFVWKSKVPRKVKITAWKLARGRLMT